MARRFFHGIMLTVVFPCLVSMVVYYGFATNYTTDVFHEAGFRSQYETGIYKYRVLGRYLLLKTHDLINSDGLPGYLLRRIFAKSPASAAILDEQMDATFYAAYFLQNTFFMVAACVVLYFILSSKGGGVSITATHMIGSLIMGSTQYVIAPYDTLSYFLFLLSFLLILRPFKHSFPLLILTLVVSTLARESAAMILAFYFAYHFISLKRLRRVEIGQLVVLIVTYLTTYFLLRIFLGFDKALWQNINLGHNLTDGRALAGIAALPIVSYLLCVGKKNWERCVIFLVASSPYFLGSIVVARGWEMRLWVPIWLGLICLARAGPNNSVQATSRTTPECNADGT